MWWCATVAVHAAYIAAVTEEVTTAGYSGWTLASQGAEAFRLTSVTEVSCNGYADEFFRHLAERGGPKGDCGAWIRRLR